MKKILYALVLVIFVLGMVLPVYSGEITLKMNQKIEAYKKKAVEWAANPTIIKAVQESNAKGPHYGKCQVA